MTKSSSSLIFLTIVVLGLCSFTASAESLNKQLDVTLSYNIFKDWTSKFNQQFGIEEMSIRFYNWKSNYDFVLQQNSQDLDFKLEMNDFAAMTPEEFSALHLGLRLDLEANRPKRNSSLTSSNSNSDDADDSDYYSDDTSDDTNDDDTSDDSTNTNSSSSNLLQNKNKKKSYSLPKSVDWRKSNAVTKVKNQGQCGGCWAFAASGALEGLHAIKNKKLVTFSDQQMIDCAGGSWGNQGCDGGLMTAAFQYTQTYGIEPEKGYEYAAKVGTCKQNPKRVAFRHSSFREVPVNNFTALKVAVAKQPVSIGIEASSMTVQLFKSGVITANCGTALDHGVLIVGYDKTPKGQEYWILKNSWGSSWGLNGYFHVAMGSHNKGAGLCGVNMMASYPTL